MSYDDEIRQNRVCLECDRAIDPCDLASMQCGHTFHYQCLQVSLGSQISKKIHPICCPISECLVEPSMYFMSVVLDDPDFERYVALEKESQQTFQNYSCTSCQSTFLAYPSTEMHKCMKCSRMICLQCSDTYHPGKTCKQATSSSSSRRSIKTSQKIEVGASEKEQQKQQQQSQTSLVSPLVNRRSTAKFSITMSNSQISTSTNTPAGPCTPISSSIKSPRFSKVGSRKVIPAFKNNGAPNSFESPVFYFMGEKSGNSSSNLLNETKGAPKGQSYSLAPKNIRFVKRLPNLKQNSNNSNPTSSPSSASLSSIPGAQHLSSNEDKSTSPMSDSQLESKQLKITSRRTFSSIQIDCKVEN